MQTQFCKLLDSLLLVKQLTTWIESLHMTLRSLHANSIRKGGWEKPILWTM